MKTCFSQSSHCVWRSSSTTHENHDGTTCDFFCATPVEIQLNLLPI